MVVVDTAKVCVTGAGGFLGSWVVKLLLSKDFIVHGTVRDPSDDKNAHLRKLDKASENLKLFKADLLDYESICAAIQGCSGVFHVASPVPFTPVPNPEARISLIHPYHTWSDLHYASQQTVEGIRMPTAVIVSPIISAAHQYHVELVEPAVKGTLNVLKASLEAEVKRVVFVSSVSAVIMNPRWSEGQVLDETCWSDMEYCRKTENWYSLSKTEAEFEALEFARKNGLDLVTVCPTLILGPTLQPTVNASTLVFIKILKEGYETLENKSRVMVDVRDVAQAVLLVYEKPEAEGRYICTSHRMKVRDLVEELRSLYPNYNYPKNYVDVEVDFQRKLSSEKLQRLGWTFRPLNEMLIDSVEKYREAGLLD